MTDEITLAAKNSRDRFVLPGLVFLVLTFSEDQITVQVCPNREESILVKGPLWDHTTYELEKLAVGLRYLASGAMTNLMEVPSQDMLVGPQVGLFPALSFGLAHPGIPEGPVASNAAPGLTLYAEAIQTGIRSKRLTIQLNAIYSSQAASGRFEVEDIEEFCKHLYEKAKALSVQVGPFFEN